MKRLLQGLMPVLLAVGLIGCGPTKKSVYPPSVSIQQLTTLSSGQWQLTVRIQNNSYTGMDFTALDGQLQIAALVPVRLHATFKRDIPTLSGDVIALDVLPTSAMNEALAAIASQGSAGSLAYRISGSVIATPERENKPAQDAKPQTFDFHGNDWLSPVPGIAHTYR